MNNNNNNNININNDNDDNNINDNNNSNNNNNKMVLHLEFYEPLLLTTTQQFCSLHQISPYSY